VTTMRRVVVPVAVLVLLLPLALSIIADAEQVPLAADIDRGIVVWDTVMAIYRQGTGPHTPCLNAIIGSDDARTVLAWGDDNDNVYVVIYVQNIDPYGNAPPSVQVIVGYPTIATGSVLYSSDYISIPRPGVYEVALPILPIKKSIELHGSFKLAVCLANYNTNVAAGAPDGKVAVVIDRVILAPPPQGVAKKPSSVAQEQPMRAQSPGDVLLYATGGAGAVALLVFAAHVLSRRR